MFDYGIIGGGIAGSVLAMKLYQKGKTFILFDDVKSQNTSTIAGGLINPITGKNPSLTWNAKPFWDELFPFYQSVENLLDHRFFYPKSIAKILPNNTLINDIDAQGEDHIFSPFIEQRYHKEFSYKNIINPYGYLDINKGAYLDSATFLKGVRNFCVKNNSFIDARLKPLDIKKEAGKISIFNYEFKNLVMACGYRSFGLNAATQFLYPAKGEVLHLHIPRLETEKIINKGFFVLPIGKNVFKVGSNYNHQIINENPSEEGKSYILKKYDKVLKLDYELIKHLAGVRPATKDRYPILGNINKNVYVFNGFGSKGISMAPLLSEYLFHHIESGQEIDPKINVKRFG